MQYFKNRSKILSRTCNRSLLTATLALAMQSCGNYHGWNPLQRGAKQESPTLNQTAPEISQVDIPDDPLYKAAIMNTDRLIAEVNLRALQNRGYHGKSMTIAILDNGFAGLRDALGKRLPPQLKVEPSPLNNEAATPHGTKLAEIIFALTSGASAWYPTSQHPNIKLYNSNGFTNFSAAVDQAIADRVDMIVYSQVWEYGGNFDGKGFINAVVDRATQAGILWINAAGNYRSSSWQGPIMATDQKTLKLPYEGKYVRMVVNEPSTKVKLTLSWNDFTDQKDWMTARDLDIKLYNTKGHQIAEGVKIQDGKKRTEEEARSGLYSSHAREIIETVLQPGIYLIGVDQKSQNFDLSSRMRIAADGLNISFIDQATDASVMIPADNPRVLTVGASDDPASSFGQTLSGQHKPEIAAPSFIELESFGSIMGTSTAAAVTAATLAVLQDACGKMTRELIVERINDGRLSHQSTAGRGLWIQDGICVDQSF